VRFQNIAPIGRCAEEQLKPRVDILRASHAPPAQKQDYLFTLPYLTVPIALAIATTAVFGDLRETSQEKSGSGESPWPLTIIC